MQNDVETHQQLFATVKVRTELGAEVAVWDLEVLAEIAVVSHESQVAVVRYIGQLVVLTLNVGHVHVVSGGADIFVSEEKSCQLKLVY